MKKYLILYLIISFFMNTLFLFVFSILFGNLYSIDLSRFLSASIFHVLPFTLITFVVVGIGVCYFTNLIIKKKKFLLFIPLVVLTGVDAFIFVQFFNTSDLPKVLMRMVFLISSYLVLYLMIKVSLQQKSE
ncbi:hypothetical protein GCM10023331_05710 [Algivirga pacifica]|uniref:Uncharacterized protein n=1 Tax=Algivirga pacifica TaxID=1162670 RepID=A0ABP9D2G6_9BACT